MRVPSDSYLAERKLRNGDAGHILCYRAAPKEPHVASRVKTRGSQRPMPPNEDSKLPMETGSPPRGG